MADLTELAQTATDEYRLAISHANSAVEHAIKCGEALLELQPLVPVGKWGKWCREHIPDMTETTISNYCRIAVNRKEIEKGSFSTIHQAMGYLHALGVPSRPTGPTRQYARKVDPNEARKLKDQGLSYVDVGKQLGVSHQHVAFVLEPDRREHKKVNDRRRALEVKAMQEALEARHRDEQIHAIGGNAALAYALLGKCEQIIDQAVVDHRADETTQIKLRTAIGFVRKATEEIVRALDVKPLGPISRKELKARLTNPQRSNK